MTLSELRDKVNNELLPLLGEDAKVQILVDTEDLTEEDVEYGTLLEVTGTATFMGQTALIVIGDQ